MFHDVEHRSQAALVASPKIPPDGVHCIAPMTNKAALTIALLQAAGAVTLGQLHQEWFERLDQVTEMLLVMPPDIDGA